MNISMAILAQYLQHKYEFNALNQLSDNLSLSRPIFYNKNDTILNNKIYLCKSSNLQSMDIIPDTTLFLSIGKLNNCKLNTPSNIFEFNDDTCPFTLFNAVQDVFDIYDNWENSLQSILNDGGSIDNMIECSLEIFNNPIVIFASDHSVLAYSSIATNLPDVNKIVDPNLFYEFLNIFKFDPLFNLVRDYKKPFLFPSHIMGMRSLASNIFFHNKFTYRIVIAESLTDIRDGDLELLGYFTKYIKLHFEKQDILNSTKLYTLSQLLSKILSKEILDNKLIEESLSEFGWLNNHKYFCMNIKISELDIKNRTINSICSRIESLVPYSCAFSYENDIVVFVNLSLGNVTQDDITCKFFAFLRDCYLKSGISNTFTGFSEVRNYYKQASISLDIGLRKRTYTWIHKFDDIVYPYILECCTKQLPSHLICSRKIILLKEYDDANGTEYYLTLKTYLENHLNAVKSAKQLFIHRSTFLYRLDRIKELVNVNFDDTNMLLYILLSYKLLDKDEEANVIDNEEINLS